MWWTIIIALILTNCSFSTSSNNEVGELNNIDERIRWQKFVIYPGTKWCGGGNIADNYTDLGEYAEPDKCCRDHDHCPDMLLPGETKHGLQNDCPYTRLNCKCDNAFHKCLKNAKTKESDEIGGLYFDAINTRCYKLEYPILECVKEIYTPFTKCKEYKLDKSKKKIYQWFTLLSYSESELN